MYASSRNMHFFTKWCYCQTYQNYEQPPQTSLKSDFQCCELVKSFQKKSSKNIELNKRPTIIKKKKIEILNFLNNTLFPKKCTLESGIDVAPRINVASGKFVKQNKHSHLKCAILCIKI